MASAQLPTPAPSVDLAAKPSDEVTYDPRFTLPSPQISPKMDAPSVQRKTPRLLAPQPTSRKRPRSTGCETHRSQTSLLAQHDDSAGLPAPPQRSRKIIQMKPNISSASSPTSKAAATEHADGLVSASQRRRPAGATTAASRRTARKTAHSLIEKRRRGKMNEEFSTLKEMVPACKENEEEGNKAADWHKLAILQASIDYIRYLEQCVSDLKGTVIQHSSGRTSVQSLRSSGFLTTALSMGTALHLNQEFRRNEEPAAPSYPTSSSFQAPSENPLMQQYHQQHQHYSFNSSPNLGPLSSPIHSHFSSPAILPHSYQGSVDSGGSLEAGASEALLLLNRDRRRSSGKSTSASPGQHGGPRSIQDPTKSGKALSVRDLLAS